MSVKLLQSVFVLLLISEHAFAESKYCVQVKTAYDFDRNDMKPAVERILKNFDYARIDKRGNQLVLRVGNYEHYSRALKDLTKIQESYVDAYIRRCDYDPSKVIFEFKNHSYKVQEEDAPAKPAIKLQADPQDELEYKIATGEIVPTPPKKIEPSKEIEPEREIFVLEEDTNGNILNEPQKQTSYRPTPPREEKLIPQKRFEYTKHEKYDYALWHECKKCFAPIELEPDYKYIKEAALRKEALRKKEQEEKNALKLHEVKSHAVKKSSQEDVSFFDFFSSSEEKKTQENFFKDTSKIKKAQTSQNEPVVVRQQNVLPQPQPQVQIQKEPEALEQTTFDDVDDFFNITQASVPQRVATPTPSQVAVTKVQPQQPVVKRVAPIPKVKNTPPEEFVQTSFDDVDDFFSLEQENSPKQIQTPSTATPLQVRNQKEQPRQQVAYKVSQIPEVENNPIDKILAIPVENTQPEQTPKREEALFTPKPQEHSIQTESQNEYDYKTREAQDEILELPKKKKSFFSFLSSDSLEETQKETPNNDEENIYEEPEKKVKSGIYDMFDIDDVDKPLSAVKREDFKDKVAKLEPNYDIEKDEDIVQQTSSQPEPIIPQKRAYSSYQEQESYKEPPRKIAQENKERYNFSQPIKEPIKAQSKVAKEEEPKMELEHSYDEYQPIATQSEFSQPLNNKTKTPADSYSGFAEPISSDNQRETKRVKKDIDPIDMYEDIDDSYTQVSYSPKYKKKKVRKQHYEEPIRKKAATLLDEYDDVSGNGVHQTQNKEKYDLMSEYEE